MLNVQKAPTTFIVVGLVVLSMSVRLGLLSFLTSYFLASVGGEVFKNSPCVSRQHTPIIPDLGIKPEKKLTFLD